MPETLKRALVTGATGGLGREFAQQLAADGWRITAVGRQATALDELCSTLPGEGHAGLAADLETAAGMDLVAGHLRTVHHTLLVNNAGFGLYGAFDALPLDRQRAMIRLNCEALTVLAHAFLEVATPGDTLLNVASTLGFTSMPYGATYAATKAFVIGLSQGLWDQQRKRGVHVFALCPGATHTPFHANAGATEASPFPPIAFQQAAEVVRVARRAIAARRGATKVSGVLNKLLVASGRLLPRTWLIQIMGTMVPKTSA